MIKDDKIFIRHILTSIDAIMEYTKGMNESLFLSNKLVQDGVVRNFEIIGEATKKISEQTKKKYPEIPWRKMAGMRDKLIHDYIGVDLFAVWAVIEKVLPELKNTLKSI